MDEGPSVSKARLVAELRHLLTMKTHYYPEGGWGVVIVVIAVIVHVLNEGLVTSFGVFYLGVREKFGPTVAAGE